MAQSTAGQIVNLEADDPSAPKIVVVQFNGSVLALTRDRILELLRREEELICLKLGRPPEDQPARERPEPAAKPQGKAKTQWSEEAPSGRELSSGPERNPDSLTHASLSNRIKKMFDYSSKSQRLRPTHAGYLLDLLRAFDWSIPVHSSSKLELHLMQIADWEGVPRDLSDEIRSFLKRYAELRSRTPGPRAAS